MPHSTLKAWPADFPFSSLLILIPFSKIPLALQSTVTLWVLVPILKGLTSESSLCCRAVPFRHHSAFKCLGDPYGKHAQRGGYPGEEQFAFGHRPQ